MDLEFNLYMVARYSIENKDRSLGGKVLWLHGGFEKFWQNIGLVPRLICVCSFNRVPLIKTDLV